jgi:hypothetical protein
MQIHFILTVFGLMSLQWAAVTQLASVVQQPAKLTIKQAVDIALRESYTVQSHDEKTHNFKNNTWTAKTNT